MNYREKVQAMMQRTGESYHQCCKRLGAAGGKARARKRRLQREAVATLEREKLF